jgi:hypothetical protein
MPGTGDVNLGGPSPFGQIFKDLEQPPATSADEAQGLATLQQLTDQVLEKGYVTVAELQQLKELASLVAPSLSPPKQELINTFLDEINKLPSTPGGERRFPIGSGKNAFLNCSAVLQLFIMTSEVIGLLSKIQLAENLYKAKLAMVMKDMADSAYKAGIESGKIEAFKEEAQAAKAAMDANLAIGQMVIGITMAVTTKINEKRIEADFRKGVGYDNQRSLTADERATISRKLEQEMAPLRNTTDGLIQAMKSTAEAAMHHELSKADIQAAVQRATAELLNKLMDIVSQSVSTLSKSADTDMAKSIQAMMDLMATAIRTYGEIGSRG